MIDSIRPRPLTAELLNRLDQRLLEIGAPISRVLQPGLTDAQIESLTSEIGLSFSTEARLWWTWHNGVEGPELASTIGGGWTPISLQDAVQDAVRQRQKAALWNQDFPGNPTGAWLDSWIAFCATPSPARLACDCAVSPDAPSPVLYFDPEFNDAPHRAKAPSIGELVHAWIEALDDGTWHIDPATGDFAPVDPVNMVKSKGRDIADLL